MATNRITRAPSSGGPVYNPGYPYRQSSPYGQRGSEFHVGIDYAARAGTPIPAASPGDVIYSGPSGGFGYAVMVESVSPDGSTYYTIYGHVDPDSALSAGARITQAGVPIGNVGTPNPVEGERSTGPHVHFEITTQELLRQYGKTPNHGSSGGLGFSTRQKRLFVNPNEFTGWANGAPYHALTNANALVPHLEQYLDYANQHYDTGAAPPNVSTDVTHGAQTYRGPDWTAGQPATYPSLGQVPLYGSIPTIPGGASSPTDLYAPTPDSSLSDPTPMLPPSQETLLPRPAVVFGPRGYQSFQPGPAVPPSFQPGPNVAPSSGSATPPGLWDFLGKSIHDFIFPPARPAVPTNPQPQGNVIPGNTSAFDAALLTGYPVAPSGMRLSDGITDPGGIAAAADILAASNAGSNEGDVKTNAASS